MLLVVTGVSALIHLYSVGYMHDDPGYARYFAYLNLFVFSMTMLVLAGDFLVLYVFWEAVGLCSYLLIGFWYTRPAAAQAGKKAFVVNRVGDLGFGLGIMWLWTALGTLDYAQVFASVDKLAPATATGIALLLFMGACGKSAQLPLHTWLPDAMEGPTPVSALIHAATMVTAGVYLVGRMHPIYDVATYAHSAVAIIGAVTALFAATIAVVQVDIKRVLAFSKPDDNMVHVLWAVGFATALITGFYTGRMWWLSFWGKPSPQRPVEHPHAPRLVMMVPVAILAILATVGGFIQTTAIGVGPSTVTDFLETAVGPQRWEGGGAEIAVTFLTMILAAALFVWALYSRPWSAYAPWAQRLLERKYYFDEIYDRAFVRPTDWIAGFALRDIERPVIDAAVVDTGLLARAGAGGLSLTQSGYFRNYVLVFVGGALVAAVFLIVRASS